MFHGRPSENGVRAAGLKFRSDKVFSDGLCFSFILRFCIMPHIHKRLEIIMSEWPLPAFEQKICPPEELAARLAALPRPLVFTNGCFDILHRGHVTYLAQARGAGASLVLALNTDASVRRLGKGDDRPVNPLENRAAVAAALESVDLVTWFGDDTPAALIERIRPDILIKGGDWPADKIIGAKETLARGGKVYSIPFLHQTSTTKTLEKIRAAGAGGK